MKRAVGRLIIACVCLLGGMSTAWVIHRWMAAAAPAVPGDSRAVRTVSSGAAGSAHAVLWLLAIGVSRYNDPSLNLQFADADARAVAESFAKQSAGMLYREVRTQVLTNDEVTRESILDGLNAFLGRVGIDDIVVLFLAGHGVQERTTGSYYFLPAPASPLNMLTAGLRVSDLDQMIRVLRATVRGVVVLLDACHAGALSSPASNNLFADELVSRFSAAEGTFLLASSRPGEESKELPELRHGAFSAALLEGLDGAADSNHDGWVPISELFGYVARRVPALTDDQQHPYHKIEGTDLVLATASGGSSTLVAGTAPAPLRPQLATNTVGVIEFRNLRNDAQHEWMGTALRVAFNTELSKVGALRVYVPQLIDRTAISSNADDLTVARRLGIHTLITGSFHVVGTTLRVDAEIVDVATGVQKASDSVEGDIDSFFQLQKTLVVSMLRRLRVQLSPEEGKSIQENTNTDVDAYRLLLETEGVVGAAPPGAASPVAPTPSLHSALEPWWSWLLNPAYAAEAPEEIRIEVLKVLEEFRDALEHKDMERLARVYVSFSQGHREALRSYFDNAQELAVEIVNVALEMKDDGVLVSYTRRDRFIDRQSNKPVQLEARLAKRFVRDNGTWKIGSAQ